jgi:hypothetical protein
MHPGAERLGIDKNVKEWTINVNAATAAQRYQQAERVRDAGTNRWSCAKCEAALLHNSHMSAIVRDGADLLL